MEHQVLAVLTTVTITFALVKTNDRHNFDVNVDSFLNDAAKSGLAEVICSVQPGLIQIPNPLHAQYKRHPDALRGLVCVGLPDSAGRRCVPEEITVIHQNIDLLKLDEQWMWQNDQQEAVELLLPKSCHMSSQEQKCFENQYLVNNICQCKLKVPCHGNTWNETSCSCEKPRPFISTTDKPNPILKELCLKQPCPMESQSVFKESTAQCTCSCMFDGSLLRRSLCRALMAKNSLNNWFG